MICLILAFEFYAACCLSLLVVLLWAVTEQGIWMQFNSIQLSLDDVHSV
jgi:hypothetical protein